MKNEVMPRIGIKRSVWELMTPEDKRAHKMAMKYERQHQKVAKENEKLEKLREKIFSRLDKRNQKGVRKAKSITLAKLDEDGRKIYKISASRNSKVTLDQDKAQEAMALIEEYIYAQPSDNPDTEAIMELLRDVMQADSRTTPSPAMTKFIASDFTDPRLAEAQKKLKAAIEVSAQREYVYASRLDDKGRWVRA